MKCEQTLYLRIKPLPADYDHIAPDGSEIRELSKASNGEIAHCTLPKGGVSIAHKHKTVEEIWYFLSGHGEVWRQNAEGEECVAEVFHGISLTISTGTSFQFRNTGEEPLCFIIATMPPWPGKDEATKTKGKW